MRLLTHRPKRLLLVIAAVLVAAGGGLIANEALTQHRLSRLSDEELARRDRDPAALREVVKRAEQRADPASAAVAWTGIMAVAPTDQKAYLAAAAAWRRANRVDSTFSVLNQAYARWPKSREVLGARASFFAWQADDPQMIRTLNEWLALKTGEAEPNVRIAEAYFRQGRLEEARRFYEAALALKASVPEAHRRIALAYLRKGDLELAEQYARRAVAQSAQDGANHQLLAEILLARPTPARTTEAEAELALATAAAPQLFTSRYLLGLLAEGRGEYPKAEAQFQQCLEGNPYMTAALYHLARCEARLGRSEGSRRLAGRHLRLAQAEVDVQRLYPLTEAAPADGTLALGLARAYRELGRDPQAQNYYRRALRLRPGDAALRDEIQTFLDSVRARNAPAAPSG